ncbi:MAG: hypothetical protein MJ186_00810 [Clostridia bacterium]|nr:hypothetical protein [Clostridia bacterium]
MLAGIDVGSTGIKLSVFDGAGSRIGYAYREYSLEYLPGSRVVIDPEIWWNSLLSCFDELSAQGKLADIKAIGLSHANALIMTDKDFKPIHKAVMQLDKRGAETVAIIDCEFGSDKVFKITGNSNKEGFIWGPTLKWFRINEPALYEKIGGLFNPASYLVMKLTGEYCMDCTRATTTMLCDIEKKEWSKELCEYFELGSEVMPRLCRGSDIVGTTRGECTEHGLPEGIAVAAGAMDTVSAMTGLASGKQENALIMGSVGRFILMPEYLDGRFLNTVTATNTSKASMTPVNNAGTALKWLRNIIISSREAGDNCYERMNQLAASKKPGADGLVYLPYLNGSSCPNWDSTVRGMFMNMEAFHDAGDFCRAVMEGVGYSLAENFYILNNDIGIADGPIFCGGGGAASDTWMQIISDIIGRELLIPANLETETIGCAMLAGIGTGDLKETDLGSWNKVIKTITPDMDNHSYYQEMLPKFIKSLEISRQVNNIYK